MNNQQFSDSDDRPAPRRRARRPRRRVSCRAGSPSAAAIASASAVEAAEALRQSREGSSATRVSPDASGDSIAQGSGASAQGSGSQDSGSGEATPGARTDAKNGAQHSADARHGARGRSQAAPQGQDGANTDAKSDGSGRRGPARTIPSLPSVEDAPTVALALATSGIHPATARLVAVSAVFYAPDGVTEVAHFVQPLNPSEDPGPWHTHGFDAGELAQQIGFATAAADLKEAIEGREVILHDASFAWGFITNEFRRAQRAANRSRGRGRSGRGRGRGRSKAAPTPTPEAIIDTLATTRRQEMAAVDPRPRAIARLYGIDAPADIFPELGAAASLQRAEKTAEELLLADARLLGALLAAQLARAEEDGAAEENSNRDVVRLDPGELTADQFGLQRSTVRVDAINAPRPLENPGVPEREDGGWQLVAGMEFVVSPDVGRDPDELIERGVAAGLVYSEKLNRTSSLVVCNQNFELRGKAMHAERKDIPLLRDEEFLAALEDVADGQKATGQQSGARGGTGGRSGGRSGGSGHGGSGGRSVHGSRRKRSRGGRRRSGGRSGGKSGSKNKGGGAPAGQGNKNSGGGNNPAGGSANGSGSGKGAGKGPANGPKNKNHGKKSGGRKRGRRRGGRRRGRGGRGSNGKAGQTNLGKREN